MKKMILLFSGIITAGVCAYSQKKVANHPFEFSKGFMEKKNYESYFLAEPGNKYFMLVLRDNQKADYIVFNDNLKKVANFSPESLKNTVFNFDNEEYLGGTAGNGKFYFVYKVTDKKFIGRHTYYYVETVDPVKKTITNEQAFDIPEEEEVITSFGNFGQYFSITANNKENELGFYGLNADGKSFVKKIPFTIPPSSKKKKITDYLENIKLFTEDGNEEPGLESATEKVKIFHHPQKISIVVNEGDDPTYISSINTTDFSVEQKTIDHSPLTKDEKGKSYVNSFVFNDQLFSLILNKKNIRIAIYNKDSGELLKTHEINSETNIAAFAEAPVLETRKGRKAKEKYIEDVKSLIKQLDKGSEAIFLYKDKKGRLLISIGTYDLIRMESGGTSSSYTSFMASSPQAGYHNMRQGNMYQVSRYVPGRPSHISYSANFYNSLHFKLMIDPANFNLMRGAASASVNEQIKDYVSDISKKADAVNQFAVGEKQYFGYYSRDEKIYYIEEIFIRK